MAKVKEERGATAWGVWCDRVGSWAKSMPPAGYATYEEADSDARYLRTLAGFLYSVCPYPSPPPNTPAAAKGGREVAGWRVKATRGRFVGWYSDGGANWHGDGRDDPTEAMLTAERGKAKTYTRRQDAVRDMVGWIDEIHGCRLVKVTRRTRTRPAGTKGGT